MKTDSSTIGIGGLFDRRMGQDAKLEAVRQAVAETRREARAAFFARLGQFLQRLAALPQRRAVREELGMLSDRELADIGLTRGEVAHVFDEGFAARRNAERRVGHAKPLGR